MGRTRRLAWRIGDALHRAALALGSDGCASQAFAWGLVSLDDMTDAPDAYVADYRAIARAFAGWTGERESAVASALFAWADAMDPGDTPDAPDAPAPGWSWVAPLPDGARWVAPMPD